jgi:RNA polymerase sigma-70 factor (sigma-E family)
VTTDDEFVEFAGASFGRLWRTAFLLCGDWHTAEDLTQTTLAKVFVAWRRISHRNAVHAYAMRTLLNTYLTESRRNRPVEVLMEQLPELSQEAPGPELRLAVLAALATLPPKARAVVVLRYWADLSVDQVAGLLGCSTGNVKSQSSRALDKLRLLLGDELVADTQTPPQVPYPRSEPNVARAAGNG